MVYSTNQNRDLPKKYTLKHFCLLQNLRVLKLLLNIRMYLSPTMFNPMNPITIMSNFLFVMIPKIIAWGPQLGRGSAFTGFLPPAFFMAAIYFFWSSVMNASSEDPPLFFCSLNLSIITPTRRLRVKKLPKTMKKTK